MSLGVIQTRAGFLAARHGPSIPKRSCVIQCCARQDGEPLTRYGLTATKRLGNAVVRNRARRRLREAARQLLPEFGLAGHDYVFIARHGLLTRAWADVLDDVRSGLISLRASSSTSSAAP